MDHFILHNNRIIPLCEARLSPGQAGLLTGWGVFTTLRLYRGLPFEFKRHWERMARDARRLEVPICHDLETVRKAIVELARANGREEGMARLCLVRNEGGLWAAPSGQDVGRPPTDLLAFTRTLVPWPAAHRLRLRPMAIFSAGLYAGAKMLSWAPNSAALEKARADGFDDALLLNEKGQLAECTSANFFLVRGGKAFTPPLSSGCLPGVTREILLEIAPATGIELVEHELTTEDLPSAEEVFIGSTTREVAAVEFISPEWKYEAPGKVTLALEAAFQGYIQSSLDGALSHLSSV